MSVEEIQLPEITTPTIKVKPTRIGVVPVVVSFAMGIGITLTAETILLRVRKAKEAKAEKDVVVVSPEETPKTN